MPLEVDTARECRSGKAHRECGQTEAISGGRAGREVYRGCCGDAAVSGKAPRNRTTGRVGVQRKRWAIPEAGKTFGSGCYTNGPDARWKDPPRGSWNRECLAAPDFGRERVGGPGCCAGGNTIVGVKSRGEPLGSELDSGWSTGARTQSRASGALCCYCWWVGDCSLRLIRRSLNGYP
jgi:hypothetical protein